METKQRRIYITDYDLIRLNMLLRSQGDLKQSGKVELRSLAEDLAKAVVISSQKMVPLVITMNSHFRLQDADSGLESEYTLAFPGKQSKGNGKISVLSPLGACLLGAQELETIAASMPEGVKQYRVQSILYQPEAAGEYRL